MGPQVVCLCYHAVSADWPSPLAVTPAQLERQLAWLVDRGWTGTTFTRAVLDPPAPRTLAVTFDDAYLSVLEQALPILAALQIPGTVFAPTRFMSARQQLCWPGIDHWVGSRHAAELDSMDWDDLRQLKDRGWEVGSHTLTHPHLNDLGDQELTAELEESREQCTNELEEECVSLAYPYGRASRRVAESARRAGYRAAATIPPEPDGVDVMRRPRIGVYRVDHMRRFQIKILARRLYGSSIWLGAKALLGRQTTSQPNGRSAGT
jgi:peptidoglycan/xylan/chitin deacetylase (PgdA/CDA1 family)